MRAIGKQVVSSLACLAALLTPLGGVPHFVCRCPNGQVKSFCLGIAAKKSRACCCGGACCSRKEGRKCCCCCCRTRDTGCAGRGPRATCCGGHQAPHGEGLLPGGAVCAERPCCLKTLVAAECLAVRPEKGTVSEDNWPPGDPAAPPAVACAPSAAPAFAASRLAHSPGPPADLITLLRRLVI